ncbi:MAG TPA: hypothetical protein VGF90_02235 [Verrucomicrobiae bacterium]|jgi:hypothetical protein
MMNDEMEQFEARLRRQPVKPVPAEWRAEILAAANEVGTPQRGVRGQRNAPALPVWLANIFWPHPKAWAGLLAIWIFIFALNFSMRDKLPAVAEKSAPPAPEVLVELKQQRLLLAELIGSCEPSDADRQKFFSPKPRSERVEILLT